jgi:hypothetical protein
MMVKFEELAAQYLRLALRDVALGGDIPPSAARKQLESTLELFLPLMLRDADANYWRLEAFDAFQFPVARKTGPLEAELCGIGLLLSDETWTPVKARLRVSAESDTIVAGNCQVGDQRVGPKEPGKLLALLREQPDSVSWAFSVERVAGPSAAP